MNKEENIIQYYLVCHRLKDVLRKGWTTWNVQRDRIESVAEHIFGTQMLAIAIKSEFHYDIDIMKVVYMLAIHELGEAVIGDITEFDLSKNEKKKIEHDAVHKILNNLIDGDIIEKLFLEFDGQTSKEAKFAYSCDKLECDIQSKLYDEEHCVDLSSQEGNYVFDISVVQKMLASEKSWSNAWIKFNQHNCDFDDNFNSIVNYLLNNDFSKFNL